AGRRSAHPGPSGTTRGRAGERYSRDRCYSFSNLLESEEPAAGVLPLARFPFFLIFFALQPQGEEGVRPGPAIVVLYTSVRYEKIPRRGVMGFVSFHSTLTPRSSRSAFGVCAHRFLLRRCAGLRGLLQIPYLDGLVLGGGNQRGPITRYSH